MGMPFCKPHAYGTPSTWVVHFHGGVETRRRSRISEEDAGPYHPVSLRLDTVEASERRKAAFLNSERERAYVFGKEVYRAKDGEDLGIQKTSDGMEVFIQRQSPQSSEVFAR